MLDLTDVDESLGARSIPSTVDLGHSGGRNLRGREPPGDPGDPESETYWKDMSRAESVSFWVQRSTCRRENGALEPDRAAKELTLEESVPTSKEVGIGSPPLAVEWLSPSSSGAILWSRCCRRCGIRGHHATRQSAEGKCRQKSNDDDVKTRGVWSGLMFWLSFSGTETWAKAGKP